MKHCLLGFWLFFASGMLMADTVVERFAPPVGYQRELAPAHSFAAYLRRLSLHPIGSPVHLYDGRIKSNQVHAAVFNLPLLKQDLIQCADAIMMVRAEYLYSEGYYQKLVFTISNGMVVPFNQFAKGMRIKVSGNKTSWIAGYSKGKTRNIFNEWLRFIYSYAGTKSLEADLLQQNIGDIAIGDVFIQGGSPGHAILVVDLVYNPATGKKLIMLAQSYMPSQEFHVLKGFDSSSPWYEVPLAALHSPEWQFPEGSLRRF